MRVLRLLIAAPFAAVLISFVLSNRAPVSLGLWPLDATAEAPLWVAILGAMVVAFLAGAVLVWLAELGQRRRARRAEQAVRRLEEEVKGLRTTLSPARGGEVQGP